MSISAIVYNYKISNFLKDSSKEDEYAMLYNSVKSIRNHNKDIPIIVFYENKFDVYNYKLYGKYDIQDFNVKFFSFDYVYDRGYISRWKNYIDSFKHYRLDRILCLSNNTFIQQDPQNICNQIDYTKNWSVKDNSQEGTICKSILDFDGSYQDAVLLNRSSIEKLPKDFFSRVNKQIISSQNVKITPEKKENLYKWRFISEKFCIEKVFVELVGEQFNEFPDTVFVGNVSEKIDHNYKECKISSNQCIFCYDDSAEYILSSSVWSPKTREKVLKDSSEICHFCCKIINKEVKYD